LSSDPTKFNNLGLWSCDLTYLPPKNPDRPKPIHHCRREAVDYGVFFLNDTDLIRGWSDRISFFRGLVKAPFLASRGNPFARLSSDSEDNEFQEAHARAVRAATKKNRSRSKFIKVFSESNEFMRAFMELAKLAAIALEEEIETKGEQNIFMERHGEEENKCE